MDKKYLISHEGEIDINEIKIPCYVLKNGDRILSTAGLQRALGLEIGENQRSSGRLDEILNSKAVTRYLPEGKRSAKYSPISCYKGKKKISGYPADLLPEICDIMLKVRDYAIANKQELGSRQLSVINHADILMRSLAKIGIIALVDEATGYQYDREAKELQTLLKAYVSEELLVWQKRFPDVFYQEIFRLNGWAYTVNDIKKRPGVIGTWTNNLIYKQLPKGVLDELKKQTPRNSKGATKHRFHQLLTLDVGHADLQRQLSSVITIMKLSKNWDDFMEKFNQLYGQTTIDFEDAQVIEVKEPTSTFDKALKTAINYNPKKDD